MYAAQPAPGYQMGAPAAPAQKKSKVGLIIGIIAGVSVLLIVLAILLLFVLDTPIKQAIFGENPPINNNNNNNNNTNQTDIKEIMRALNYPTNVTTGTIGQTLANEFFDWKVSSVATAETLTASNGSKVTPYYDNSRFIIVDTTVKNTFNKPIPVGNYDFTIIFEDGGKAYEDEAYLVFMNGMYPDDIAALAVGSTQSGKLVFEAPKSVSVVYIAYIEFYSDGTIGDPYVFKVNL